MPSKKNACFMAFDYGRKKIGVAVGQLITKTAVALSTLKANQGEPDWNEVSKLIEKWLPQGLVVGIPYNMDDTEGFSAKAARKFSNRLEEKFNPIPVYRVDERLTSFAAKTECRELETYGLYPKSIDEMAAQIILEQWFCDNHSLLL